MMFLLFLTPYSAPANEKPYLKGNALEVLSQVMDISTRQNLDYLSTKYNEVCIKCNRFRTHISDHCTQTDACILESHGFSSLFNRQIHLLNFRAYFLCVCSFFVFLSLCGFSIIKWQRVLALTSSQGALRLVELHLIGALRIVKEQELHLLPLFFIEGMWLPVGWHVLQLFYCIGAQMTMLEMERPYQFVSTRIGTMFKVERRTKFLRKQHSLGKMKKQRLITFHYQFLYTSILRMLWNITKFLLCCQKGVHTGTQETTESLSSYLNKHNISDISADSSKTYDRNQIEM
jgi:hypothetical protein